jgi:D-glycerate 3-kinase
MALDTYDKLLARIEAAAIASGRMFVVGLCGPQGSGKSTLASLWQQRLRSRGLHTIVLSLDDFYLTREQRITLSEQVHPLLRTRGVPGTHDVRLALDTLAALSQPGSVALPAFDKAQDDRRPESEWIRVVAPAQVVIFEGWCIGAVPQNEAALAIPVNELERDSDVDGRWRRYVNERLGNEYQTLFARLDMLVLLEPPSFDVVFRWRRQQELGLRERHRTAAGVMDDAELRRFIQHYERITRHMLSEMPRRADVVISLDEMRRPT